MPTWASELNTAETDKQGGARGRGETGGLRRHRYASRSRKGKCENAASVFKMAAGSDRGLRLSPTVSWAGVQPLVDV